MSDTRKLAASWSRIRRLYRLAGADRSARWRGCALYAAISLTLHRSHSTTVGSSNATGLASIIDFRSVVECGSAARSKCRAACRAQRRPAPERPH